MNTKKYLNRLIEFKKIFERNDFNFICDNYLIFEKSIKEFYAYNQETKKDVISLLENYKESIISFLGWSYSTETGKVKEWIGEFNNLFKMLVYTLTEKNNFSRNQTKKIMKLLITLLMKDFYNFVKTMFYYTNISKTNLSNKQIISFILNKKIGFGKRYEFNAADIDFGFVNQLKNLQKRELYELVKHLEVRDIRKDAKRDIMGRGRYNYLRIHLQRKKGLFGGKIKIYQIFRNPAERDIHEKEIRHPIESVQFVPL